MFPCCIAKGSHREVTELCGLPSKQWRNNGFRIAGSGPCRCRFDGIGKVSDKALVKNSRVRQLEPATQSGPQAMPRYFFNTRIGDELISDPEGEELRNPDPAW